MHSPEPWRVGTYTPECTGVAIWHANNDIVVEADAGPTKEELEDWERIVACVNALAGIPTECLQNLPSPPENWNLAGLLRARYNLRTILARTEELLP